MEELASDTNITTSIRVDTRISICPISKYWVTYMGHMDSDLMSTTCLDATLEEGITNSRLGTMSALILNYLVVCHCTLPSFIDSNLGFFFGIRDPQESHPDSILSLGRDTDYNSMIHLIHIMGLELR
jgi:hypothetical protein